MSDALKIARFLWPDKEWRADPATGGAGSNDLRFVPTSFGGCNGAEHAIIARGLAEEYGEALCRELFGAPGGIEPHPFAQIRTAPLECIVRALVAVIDAQEAKRG